MIVPSDKQLQLLAALEQQKELRDGLPHLFQWKDYDWAKEFFGAREQFAFLTAANQVSKTSSLIRLNIRWATDRRLWEELWDLTQSPPRQFWYLMPNKEQFTSEIYKKWIPEFLPRNRYKADSDWAWELEVKNKYVNAIHFTKTGVTIYSKSYNQDVQDLMGGTCHLISIDEELPIEPPNDRLWGELCMRVARYDGYVRGVFTPTLNQEFWRRVMEERGKLELLPQAKKIQVSMYDCQKYADGTPGPWTDEKIARAKASCQSEAEVQRRVYGRFVSDSNKKYPSFGRAKNVQKGHPLPKSWRIYSGIDYGSGGADGHPSAIAFVAVNEDFTAGRVFRAWRGDDIITTADDVIRRWRDMRGHLECDLACYDWSCKDLETVAARMGETLTKANKSHDDGESILNVLFRNQMLQIYEETGDPENDANLEKLVQELIGLKKNQEKRHAKDDLADALRYAVTKIPWDFSAIGAVDKIEPEKKLEEFDDRNRRREPEPARDEGLGSVEDELNGWQREYEDPDEYSY